MCEELRATQSRTNSLQASLDNAQQDNSAIAGKRMEERCLNGYQVSRLRSWHLDGEKET